nr:type III secretion system export apparatus subunit SctT [Aeromonas schubertii]
MMADELQGVLLAYTLLLPRFMACFVMLPVLGKQMLGGTLIRNGVICSLALYAYPTVTVQPELQSDAVTLMLLIGKEVVLGLLIGFVATIPFWAIEAAGFLIDNQRGAAMASLINPSLGSQSSPTGLLLTQALVTLFFSGGAFLSLLAALFHSYATWPVASFFPEVGSQWVDFFYGQFSQMLLLAGLLAAPLLIAMFLAEFGLALISRFAPSLNVFVLAMPIKSAVASLLLVIYCALMMDHAYEAVQQAMEPVLILKPVLEMGR